jgi:hypothetical protein
MARPRKMLRQRRTRKTKQDTATLIVSRDKYTHTYEYIKMIVAVSTDDDMDTEMETLALMECVFLVDHLATPLNGIRTAVHSI